MIHITLTRCATGVTLIGCKEPRSVRLIKGDSFVSDKTVDASAPKIALVMVESPHFDGRVVRVIASTLTPERVGQNGVIRVTDLKSGVGMKKVVFDDGEFEYFSDSEIKILPTMSRTKSLE